VSRALLLSYGAAASTYDPAAASLVGKLTAWWEMTEGSGATRNDSIGTTHLLDPTAGVGTSTGPRGDTAASFPGTAGLESSGDAANVSVAAGGGDHCLFGWAYFNATTGTNQFFAAKWNASTSAGMEYACQLNGSSTIVAQNGGSAYRNATTAAPSAAAWHFYVMWRDSADGLVRLQIDNGSISVASASSNPSDTTNKISFGQTIANTLRLTGRLQRWGFTNTAILTADEKTYLYNSGNQRTWAEIVAASVP
jgi:hypothetical protein